MSAPHPDEVAEAVGVLRYYGGTTGPMGDEAMRRALCAAVAWRERQAAQERAHQRNHRIASDDAAVIHAVAETVRRAAAKRAEGQK